MIFRSPNYQLLKEKTKLGSNIAKNKLSQKYEDIIRAQTVDACNENSLTKWY